MGDKEKGASIHQGLRLSLEHMNMRGLVPVRWLVVAFIRAWGSAAVGVGLLAVDGDGGRSGWGSRLPASSVGMVTSGLATEEGLEEFLVYVWHFAIFFWKRWMYFLRKGEEEEWEERGEKGDIRV